MTNHKLGLLPKIRINLYCFQRLHKTCTESHAASTSISTCPYMHCSSTVIQHAHQFLFIFSMGNPAVEQYTFLSMAHLHCILHTSMCKKAEPLRVHTPSLENYNVGMIKTQPIETLPAHLHINLNVS